MGRVPEHSLDGQTIVTGICVNCVLGAAIIGGSTLVAAWVATQFGLLAPFAAQAMQQFPLTH